MGYTANIEPQEAHENPNYWAWNCLYTGRRSIVIDYDGYTFREVLTKARTAALGSEFDRPHLTIFGDKNRIVYSRRVIGRGCI